MATGVINMIDKTPLLTVEGVTGTNITEAAKDFYEKAPGTSLPSFARFYWKAWRFALIFKSGDGNTGIVLLLSFNQSDTTIPFLRRQDGVWKDSYIQLS